MRSRPTANNATGRSRPSFKSATGTVAAGLVLATAMYPAIAAGPAAAPSTAATRAAVSAATAGRFNHYLGETVAHPSVLPAGARPQEQVTVVVRLDGTSVATARSMVPDHKISADTKASIHQTADAQQAAILPAIEARGGKVLAQYRDALNGVKVQIASSEVEGLKVMPGVAEVMPVAKYHTMNVESVPFIGAPAVWQGTPGYKGKGIKIAIIDTGIDYTHANFGGPGTVAAFNAAAATSTKPADPKYFGPNAPKVKGGIDLVGDNYDANVAGSVPVPDPNPLDCNGHGSHTAGSAAGLGVGSDGKTYHGPLTSAVYGKNTFSIGPGVAPEAELYAVRVFGCTGSTNVVVDAIDWAVAHDMDVISMSLGSDFGDQYSADALAVKNATTSGVVVVAASGNSGPAPYITSTPAAGQGGISVAAIDSHKSFPGALLSLSTNSSVQSLVANGVTLPGALDVVVLRTAAGDVSLGCNESEYVDSKIAGKLVVTLRGSCARVLRAQLGQKHGAAAVAMINVGAGFPPYEGPIPNVTIPFLGVLASDTTKLTAAPKVSKLAANTIANPGFAQVASFSSGGPRIGDSALRPNVAAPGVSVFSTQVGSGNGGLYESGTSMATPHVAGVAALAIQAHPNWNNDAIRSAVVESAAPSKLTDFNVRLEGAGLVQTIGATQTQAVVVNGGQRDGMPKGFFFGFEEFAQDFKATREMTVWNYGTTRASFTLSTTAVGGSPHKAQLSDTHISLEPHSFQAFKLTLSVPAKTVGAAHDAAFNDAFHDVAGYVTLTPTDSSSNSGVALTVPYYLVPRTRSNVVATLPDMPTADEPVQALKLTNAGGAIPGNADVYTWGLIGTTQKVTTYNTRAVGVQSLPVSATDALMVFAVSTYTRFSSAAPGEFDIRIDTNGDGVADYLLASIDEGLFLSGTFSGLPVTVLVNLATGVSKEEFLVDAPTDGSTLLLPVLASDMGVTPSHPRISYTAAAFNNLDGSGQKLPGVAAYNVFSPALANGLFVPVAPGKSASALVSFDPVESRKTPAKGLMVVVSDNFAGTSQAQLIPVNAW